MSGRECCLRSGELLLIQIKHVQDQNKIEARNAERAALDAARNQIDTSPKGKVRGQRGVGPVHSQTDWMLFLEGSFQVLHEHGVMGSLVAEYALLRGDCLPI